MSLGPPNFFHTIHKIDFTNSYEEVLPISNPPENSLCKFFFLFRQDCRAGLNFCDELEAFAFRAAIKERIKDFKRKRRGL